MAKPLLPWIYTLRWALRHRPCPGPEILGRAQVPAGQPCPPELAQRCKPGDGYAIFIDFVQPEPRRWSPERKAAARQRRLAARVTSAAPLFADELIARELAARPDYYAADSIDAEPD